MVRRAGVPGDRLGNLREALPRVNRPARCSNACFDADISRFAGRGGLRHFSTLTTRAMISAAMRRAIADCSIMVILDHRLVGRVSVGLNAVALVKARYR